MSVCTEKLAQIEDLIEKDYWQSVDIKDWDITDFDRRMIESKDTNKRNCHLILSHDIATLHDSFPDNKHVIKQLKKLQMQLKLLKSIEDNQSFWLNEYPKLKKALYNKRKSTEMPESSSNKKTCSATSYLQDIEENDGVFVDGENKSVGTIIKKAAIKIHEDKFIHSIPLSPRERNIMSSGLSSILDLINITDTSQKSLFNDQQWKQLVNFYNNKYSPMKSSLSHVMNNNLKIILNTISSTADVYKGIKYINKVLGAHEGDDLRILEATKVILTNILDNPEFFIKSNPEDLKEADYLRVLWSPLLETLFRTENCIVKIKTGESVFQYTTTNKAEAYNDSKKVIGFKIDIRFTIRVEGDNLDFGCGEVAVSDSDSKIVEDEGKLLREAKEALDNLLLNCKVEDDHRCYSWIVQIAGSSCLVSTLYLDANGLYVAVPQFSFALPGDTSELNNLPDILMHLIKMKREMHRTAMAALKNQKAKNSVRFALGRGKNDVMNQRLEWIRDTWFTPPRYAESKLPINLYMHNSRNLTDELLRAKYSNANFPKDDSDEFGWTRRGDKWFNYITNETVDKSPYNS